MVALERVTVRYSDVEDRISLAGATEEGVQVIWLTRRMIDQLVPALCGWLEQRSAPAADALPGGGALPARHGAAVEQAFAQEQAWAALRRREPVQVSEGSLHWLATRVEAKARRAGLQIVFAGDRGRREVALILSDARLRQWMSILYEQCLRTGWPMHVWPLWLVEARPSRSQIPMSSMH